MMRFEVVSVSLKLKGPMQSLDREAAGKPHDQTSTASLRQRIRSPNRFTLTGSTARGCRANFYLT